MCVEDKPSSRDFVAHLRNHKFLKFEGFILKEIYAETEDVGAMAEALPSSSGPYVV